MNSVLNKMNSKIYLFLYPKKKTIKIFWFFYNKNISKEEKDNICFAINNIMTADIIRKGIEKKFSYLKNALMIVLLHR